jgi:hypothetical protein
MNATHHIRNGTNPVVTALLGLCLLGHTAAIRHRLKENVHLDEQGIFDRMMVKMTEKETMFQQEQKEKERRHIENIMRA